MAAAILLMWAVTAMGATTYTRLVVFPAYITSTSPPVLGTDGNLYGTAVGIYIRSCQPDCGFFFRLTPSGSLTSLYNFCSQPNCTDGGDPMAGLVLGNDGNFYGSTTYAGTATSGNGTIFKVTPQGQLTTLYTFPSASQPVGSLVQASDGNFYGVTSFGGAHLGGSIFRITPGGMFTTIYSFCALAQCADGTDPLGGLVQGPDGSLYGTTVSGGVAIFPQPGCPTGCGTVFKVTPAGTFTTVYNFCSQPNCTDGWRLAAGLVLAADGMFYGSTSATNIPPWGTLFSISPNGTLATLYTFNVRSNLTYPGGTLLNAGNGQFYGTAEIGDLYGNSLIYEMKGSTLSVLHEYGHSQQANPVQSSVADGSPGLIEGMDGTLYGSTLPNLNFSNVGGTIFSISTGLSPVVQAAPVSGTAGSTVLILGTNLTGTTSVSFNGVTARFTVVSATEITATVPVGATTGKVQVITPGGTLSNPGIFVVAPPL